MNMLKKLFTAPVFEDEWKTQQAYLLKCHRLDIDLCADSIYRLHTGQNSREVSVELLHKLHLGKQSILFCCL